MRTLAIMAIPLTQGLFALVDGEGYERVNQHKWQAEKSKNTYYAHTTKEKGGTKISTRMHRFVMNAKRGDVFDHKNRCGLDNRRANVRQCTYSQNNQNSKKRKNSLSKYKGVSLHGKRWRVVIMRNGEVFRFGHFDTELEAAKIYDKEAKKLFGEFALTNF